MVQHGIYLETSQTYIVFYESSGTYFRTCTDHPKNVKYVKYEMIQRGNIIPHNTIILNAPYEGVFMLQIWPVLKLFIESGYLCLKKIEVLNYVVVFKNLDGVGGVHVCRLLTHLPTWSNIQLHVPHQLYQTPFIISIIYDIINSQLIITSFFPVPNFSIFHPIILVTPKKV